MSNEIMRLHALIQYLEAIGSWGMAKMMREILGEYTKSR